MIIRVATLTGDADREPVVALRLGASPDVNLVLRCVDRVELLVAIRGGELDAIVAVGSPLWLDRQSSEEARAAGVLFLGAASDQDGIDRLTALGAELIPLDDPVEEVIELCGRLTATPRPPASLPPSVAPKGRLIAVWGPKGSPGRTTIAIELSAQLATLEPQTLLIDGDAYGGDVLQLLGVSDELPTIVWAARMAAKEELDAARLMFELRRAGERGPVLLPGITRADLWPEISEYGWGRLLTVARATFEATVCDVGFCLEPQLSLYAASGEARNRIARQTIGEADRVVAVCRAEPVSIKSFLWAYEELKTLVEPDNIVIVANRVRPANQGEVSEVLRMHTGKRPVAYLADRPRELERGVLAGKSLAELHPGSDICTGVKAVVAALGGRVKPSGVLMRLAGRT